MINPFDWLTQHLMLPLLAQAYALTGNYGWAIILLTLGIQLLLWPLTRQSHLTTQKMQQLPAWLKSLQERYQDDPAALARQKQLLFQSHQLHPVGSFLPMLIQMLFLFSLYDALSGEVFARMLAAPGVAKSFWLLPDLSHLGLWQHGQLYLENLALLGLFVLSTVFQQLRIGLSAAPGQKTLPHRAQVTMILLLFALFVLFPVPTGIFIHLLTLNLIGMVEQAYLNRPHPQQGNQGLESAPV